MVFAPGLGLGAVNYSALAEGLASRGWLVAGINPTYSTDVVLPGGRVVNSIPSARDNADFWKLIQLWSQDIRFVADEVVGLNTISGNPFVGRVVTTHVAYLGHSAGGAAAAIACRTDTRCKGAADLDGDLPNSPPAGDPKPFLFIGHQGAFTEEQYLKGMIRAITSGLGPQDVDVLSVAGTRHDNFTDRGLYFNFAGSQLGAIGSIDGRRAVTITVSYVDRFFQATSVASGLLPGPSSNYPEVTTVSILA